MPRTSRFARLRRRLPVVLLATALLAGAGVALAVPRAPHAPQVTSENLTIDVPDRPGGTGRVHLDSTLYLPAITPAPAILVAHGFGGSKDSVRPEATALARRGFVVLAWSARGFGASTGQIGLDSPDYEVADARALVDWLATRPEVTRDGPGDPRVGVTGASYGGALALLLAGTDRRVDAVAAEITWNDLAQALFPNAASRAPIPATTPVAGAFAPDGVFKRDWAAYFFGAGAAGPGGLCGRLRPEVCAAYVQAATTGDPTPQIMSLLRRSSPATVAGDITAPTLLIQGEHDTLFGLDQADATARQLTSAGTAVKVVWYAGGHDGGAPDSALQDQVGDWFDYHLRRVGTNPGTGFDYQVPALFGTRAGIAPRTVHAPAYPGLSGTPVRHRELALHGGPQSVLRPPGGSPAALSSLPGLGSLSGLGAAGVAMDLPGQTATFVTDPLTDSLQIVGAPRVRLRVAAAPIGATRPTEAVLFVKLYDLGPDGRRTLPGGAVAPVRIGPLPADGTPVEITVTLAGVVWPVPAGHRLTVAVATTDRGYALPPQPAHYTVSLDSVPLNPGSLSGGARLAVPVVPGEQAPGPLPIAQLAGLGGLAALVAVLGVFAALRRRNAEDADPELAEVPLVVSGLSKRYPGDLTAVDDLSFRVERGQVLGLLGPNGAGKTTVLRMLMGLIAPSGGTLRVFGHRVSAGSPVLSRIGAFIEGPGFLPHLSGAANLRLYWAATGRPTADAGIEEALRIAGLGHAVHRRVATYSQGMRQRLAIAQAMLGTPDLLVLDEPTNGLDPPQIHAMREVLRGCAARGATVLISSHLLAEVEQTCSHVVVMRRGRLVAAGTVAEIAGARVGGVAANHPLEEAFLQLVGEETVE
ncbi:MAG: alpha/beta fold hydrolase [Pseudonocardiaceae bacterium]